MAEKLGKEELARVLERLRRHIAIGGAPAGPDLQEEEARTNAQLACRLILRYEISLGSPSEPVVKKPLSGVDKATAAWTGPVDTDDPETQQWGAVPGRGARRAADAVIIEMEAKKFSRCMVCDRVLGVGDKIAWHKRAKRAACLMPCGEMLKAGIAI